MKKVTATKKSGTIAYQLYERNDLTGKATKKNPTMGVSIVNSKVVTTQEMADDINHASSVTQGDVAAVLQAVGQRIAEALGISVEQVNVKAKTAEKMGPVGELQAMEANAVALIYKP